MQDRNQYGLPRNIDAATKREVRQRCGFGCVNCGCAVYQYEHLDPTFANAKSHDPARIVLLCGGCHDRVTRGLLSKETVALRALKPKCKEKGFSFGPLDVGTGPLTITVGTAKFQNVRYAIQLNGENILHFAEPQEAGAPISLNAFLADQDGHEVLRIVDNEWRTSSRNWDVEVIGNRISIRRDRGDISLVMRADSPSNLVIERMNMLHRNIRIDCQEHQHMTITIANGQRLQCRAVDVQGSVFGAVITDNSVMFGIGGGSVQLNGLFFQAYGAR